MIAGAGREGTASRIGAVAVAVLATLAPPAVGPTGAQGLEEPGRAAPGWLFPERSSMPDLLAGPRDPVVKGMLVYSDPIPTRFGPSLSGEVAIAGTVPVARLLGRTAEDGVLVLGVEGAAFAHFSLAVIERELVNTDWVFAVPLLYRRGDDWLRLRYYHTSSHLGDEYQRRFPETESVNWARDGFDLVGYWGPGLSPLDRWGLGVYAGALLSVNSHPEARDIWRLRGGIELDPGNRRPWTPYAALDTEREEGNAIGWRTTAQLGLWLPRPGDRPLRLALEYQTGPSAMGQFVHFETSRVGVALLWNP